MEELYIVVDKMRDILGVEYLLDAIIKQMSYDELKKLFGIYRKNGRYSN